MNRISPAIKRRQQSVNDFGQSITNVVRLSSIRRLALNHRSPTMQIVGIPNSEDQPSHRDTASNIPIVDDCNGKHYKLNQAGEFEFAVETEFANENEVVNVRKL
ncbi:hypothetical protein MKX01_002123 [Papaver californicum]|nr:hypothetical protein MKX01_002123 [Papaver californicum]